MLTKSPGNDAAPEPKGEDGPPSLAPTLRPHADTVKQEPAPLPATVDFAQTESGDRFVRRFGRYELLEKIGGGGMGLVFRAFDTQLQREVALKTIRSGLFAEGHEIERFLNEARAIAKLDHPNVITIHEIGEEQGHHFFIMQLVSGGTLSSRSKEYAQGDPRLAVRLVEKIARAVHYAHENKILHRDLKPANILLGENDEPLVSDFGLVKFLDQDQDMTRAGRAIGTRPYMSPEQLAGLKEKISPATDIWALGVILYELVTGKRPFNSSSEEGLSQLIHAAEPPSPRKIRPQLDRDLETLILKCLRKDPTERYASAGDLAEDLHSWTEGMPIRARPMSPLQRGGRFLLRHRMAVAVLFLAGALALVATFLASLPDEPERWARDIPRQLQAGRPVTLIGKTGGPKWSRFAAGSRKERPVADKDKLFNLSDWDLSLLELVPEPGIGSYRFRGEVKHLNAAPGQHVGLYVAQHRGPISTGWINAFLHLSFTDKSVVNKDQPQKNPIALTATFCFEPGDTSLNNVYSGKAAFYKPHTEGEEPWRSVAIEVHPDRVGAFWDNQLIEEVTWEKLSAESNMSARQLLRIRGAAGDPNDKTIGFGPHLGLGLYVSASEAEFRNVVIEPIVPTAERE